MTTDLGHGKQNNNMDLSGLSNRSAAELTTFTLM